jgi:hypothetical protein
MFCSLLVAGTAAAGHIEHYSATLAQSLSGEKVIVANGNLFRCSGTTCTLSSAPKEPAAMRTCRELKRQVGTLTAYGSTTEPYDEAKLTKCNS